MATNDIRQNFHEESESGINGQINMELYASYVYMSMAYYFDRDDVALHGFFKYFKHASDEERGHAEKLMKYQNKRGGRIILKDIATPMKNDWGSPVEAMQAALQLEKDVNQSLLNLHTVATNHADANMCDFLESEYLAEQVESIKEISDHVTNLQRVGEGLGIFMFDQKLSD